MTNSDILPVQDESGNQINDSGKIVSVTSVGGALVSVRGQVVSGPMKFRQTVRYVKKVHLGKKQYAEKKVITCSYWEVLLDGCDRTVHFSERELRFE